MANAKEKKLQFYGVKQSKIQWMDLKIILIKDKNFKKKLQTLNQKVGLMLTNFEKHWLPYSKTFQKCGTTFSKSSSACALETITSQNTITNLTSTE